jgi:predicted O-methyltransferase YrrM
MLAALVAHAAKQEVRLRLVRRIAPVLPRSLPDARYRFGAWRHVLRDSRTLRRAAREAATPGAAVDAASTIQPAGRSVAPIQVRSEIEAFLSLARRERPRRVLDIGTALGGTLYLLAWASAPGARVLSLDIRDYEEFRARLYRSFGDGRRTVEVWHADSHLDETRDAVARFFDGRPLDLVFVDGDHSYEGVRRDHELYAPLLRPGGLIAFHDIVDGHERDVGGVPRFWREVRSSATEAFEFVESWEQDGFGIGVLRRQ